MNVDSSGEIAGGKALLVTEVGETPTLSVGAAPAPVGDDHSVIVAAEAAALHFADLLMMRGAYQVRPEAPFVPGMEAAGTVLEVGRGVDHVVPGDRVLAMLPSGACASVISVPGLQVARIPDVLGSGEAAGFGIAHVTAHLALHARAAVSEGDTVVVTGAGGAVGRAAVQLAVTAGARVIAVTRGACRPGVDAHAVVDADPRSLAEQIRTLSAGRGADVVVDVVGGEILGQLVRATAWEGRVVTVGFAAGAPEPIKPGHLLVRNISVSGLQSTDYWTRRPDLVRAALEESLGLVERGVLRVPEVKTFAVEDYAGAIAAVEESGGTGVALRLKS